LTFRVPENHISTNFPNLYVPYYSASRQGKYSDEVYSNDDKGVPPEDSIYFYLALRKAEVPAEMHVYEKSGQGFGLGKQHSAVSSWPVRCEDWMRGQGAFG